MNSYIPRDVESLPCTDGGDPLSWYPMRVTYGREELIKEALEQEHVEHFLPMRREDYLDDHHEPQVRLTPAIRNLIFIRSTRHAITEMKMYDRRFRPLRYMIDHTKAGADDGIMTVPHSQMENFMRVAAVPDDQVTILDEYNDQFFGKAGQRVRIKYGDFAGVEGVIRRIRKRKHVVVEIKGLIAATIDFVPTSWLTFLPASDTL